jgi:hypothetical protein
MRLYARNISRGDTKSRSINEPSIARDGDTGVDPPV